jgi:hypothetical protein
LEGISRVASICVRVYFYEACHFYKPAALRPWPILSAVEGLRVTGDKCSSGFRVKHGMTGRMLFTEVPKLGYHLAHIYCHSCPSTPLRINSSRNPPCLPSTLACLEGSRRARRGMNPALAEERRGRLYYEKFICKPSGSIFD